MNTKRCSNILKFFIVVSLILTGCVTNDSQSTNQTASQAGSTAHLLQASGIQEPIRADQYKNLKHSPMPAELPHSVAYYDLFDRIRHGFKLTHAPDNPRVIKQIEWYTRHPHVLSQIFTRARPYLHYIVEAIENDNLPLELILVPVFESAYDPFAYSPRHAVGLWQFVPKTAKHFGIQQTWWYDGRRDVHDATFGALKYLKYLNEQFDGDWFLSLAAYNAGEGRVRKAVKRNKRAGKPTDYWSLSLPRETRHYIPKLLALAEIIQYPEQYKVKLPTIDNKPFLARVTLNKQVDLAQTADTIGLSLKDLRAYNPGFNRWASDPKIDQHLLVPLAYQAKLQKHVRGEPSHLVTWNRYKVKSGDSLGLLAQKFNTTVDHIKAANHLSSHVIYTGDNLLVPGESQGKTDTVAVLGANLGSHSQHEKIKVKVKSGDSLWSIAKTYGTSIQSLAKWNSLSTKARLKIGQTLYIVPDQTSNNGILRKIAYRVRSGESLSVIASRFNLSIDKILEWNTLARPSLVQPGDTLTLYVDVTKQST